MYAKIITNRLTIIPVAEDKEQCEQEISNVTEFICGVEEGFMNEFALSHIAPIPKHLKKDSREEDDWKLRNWGTRYTTFNVRWENDNEIVFETYFNPVLPILTVLAKKFPKVDFVYAYASDDIGSKVGECYISQGELIPIDTFDDYDKYSYELAFSLMPDEKNKYVFNTQKDTYEFDRTEILAELQKNGYYRGENGDVLVAPRAKKVTQTASNEYDDLPF